MKKWLIILFVILCISLPIYTAACVDENDNLVVGEYQDSICFIFRNATGNFAESATCYVNIFDEYNNAINLSILMSYNETSKTYYYNLREDLGEGNYFYTGSCCQLDYCGIGNGQFRIKNINIYTGIFNIQEEVIMTVEKIFFLLQFAICFLIFIAKVYNIMNSGKIYELKVGIILFVIWALCYGIGFLIKIVLYDNIALTALFTLQTALFMLSIAALIAEVIFNIGKNSMPSQAYNSLESTKSPINKF
jgi:hypothetical protein